MKNKLLNLLMGCIVIFAITMIVSCNEGKTKSTSDNSFSFKEFFNSSNKDFDENALIEECKSLAMEYKFNDAHKILNRLHSELKDYYIGDGWIPIYDEVEDYVFKAEAMYLCAQGDKESIDRLLFLLNSIQIDGRVLPNGYKYEFTKRDDYEYPRYDISEDVVEKHNAYVSDVIKFNTKCDYLIDLAISNRLWDAANRILNLYKDVPSIINEKDGHHIITYSNMSKTTAQTKITVARGDNNKDN